MLGAVPRGGGGAVASSAAPRTAPTPRSPTTSSSSSSSGRRSSGRTRRRSLGDVIDGCRAPSTERPGLEVNFSQPIRDNVNENISGQFGQIAVKIYGDDLTVLQAARREGEGRHRRRAAASPTSASSRAARCRRSRSSPTARRWRATAWTLGEFQHVFETAVGGTTVGDLWEGERRFDVVLRFPQVARDDVEEICDSCASPSSGGVAVPLEALADVERGLRARLDQPRERPALHRHPHERARPRPGLASSTRRRRTVGQRGPQPAGRDASSGAASSRTRSAP